MTTSGTGSGRIAPAEGLGGALYGNRSPILRQDEVKFHAPSSAERP
jgi:hypothetical protein